jgi:pyruvate formate lyase activating enzyme
VRTTGASAAHAARRLVALAAELAAHGVTRWVLQQFRPIGCANDSLVAAAPQGMPLDDELLAALAARVPTIRVR